MSQDHEKQFDSELDGDLIEPQVAEEQLEAESEPVRVGVLEGILLMLLWAVTLAMGAVAVNRLLEDTEQLLPAPAIATVGFLMAIIILAKGSAEFKRNQGSEKLYKGLLSYELALGYALGFGGLVYPLISSL